ncbi:adhesion G-protein coupled receptor G6-like [Neocloeon triangulifer]|uniref:adhesion G-protein coupled receptor G6-like n=1 Tax=Neocloeon triangulifer TaxID=2078957 RepID=UPI00286F8247|nr:adhesion G-protein coupled receptor G6-like [Neocloeon triangulifer]
MDFTGTLIFLLGMFCIADSQKPMAEGSEELIYMTLTKNTQLSGLLLNVTIKNFTPKTVFSESSLVCSQITSLRNNKTKRVPANRLNRTSSGVSPATFLYHLFVETEGYVHCEYVPWGVLLIQSNTLFVRFSKVHVSAVRLDTQMSIKSLQMAVMDSSFKIREISPDSKIFHFDSEFYSIDPSSDRKIVQKLERVLRQKLKPPDRVEYVRSTKYCPGIEEFGIPPADAKKEVKVDGKVIRCEGDFYYGVHWRQNDLSALGYVNGTLTTVDALRIFSNSLQNAKSLNLPVIAKQYDDFVSDENGLLKEAKSLNVSNELLVNLDSALVRTPISGNFTEASRPNFAARVEDIKKTGGVGVMVRENGAVGRSGSQKFLMLTSEMSNQVVMEEDLSVAVRLPQSLLERKNISTRLVVAVFRDARSLFSDKFTTTSVVNANLGGDHYKNLDEPVIIWFKRNAIHAPNPGTCVFWDFALNDGKGNWSTEGCFMNATHHLDDLTEIDECHCSHMTHFGEILWNSDHDFASPELDLISTIGCFVSLAGLVAVFLTAAISPKLLRGIGQKILFQMAISATLLTTLFLVISNLDVDRLDRFVCFFLGFFLHYAILTNFFWMLVAAYLQYNRLVKVIYSRTPKLLLKATIVGWGLPVIPGALVLVTLQHDVYKQPPLCLPNGLAFYLTIVSPLAVILTLNFIVFALIIKNVYIMSENEPRKHANQCLSIHRFKQIAFLFALLGLSWTFGLCQVAFPEWRFFFACLFCFTVAFQGLTYFFLFVVMHEKARGTWRTVFCGGRMLFRMEWGSMVENNSVASTATKMTDMRRRSHNRHSILPQMKI